MPGMDLVDRDGAPLSVGDSVEWITVRPAEEVVARGTVTALARTRLKVRWDGRRYGQNGFDWIYPSLVRRVVSI